MNNKIFITGGSGYIGSRVITKLLKHGFEVQALVRDGSEKKLPDGCKIIFGNALDEKTFADKIFPCETFIHLIGVAHPNPKKKDEFRKIDLISVQQSVIAAKRAGIKHFIYISVAQGAVMMKEFQNVRAEGERLIREGGMNATILRPWYVTGPGHWWPILLFPVYKILELIPATRAKAKLFGLVSITQMTNAIVFATEHPADGIKVNGVDEIKKH